MTTVSELNQRMLAAEHKIELLQRQVDRINAELELPYQPTQKENAMKNEAKKTPEPVGHSEVAYPALVPIHDVGHIIGMLRGTETLTLPELGQHVATVIGCACELMKGLPEPVGAAPPENVAAMSNEEIADKLETLTAPQAAGAAPEAFPAWLLPILFDVIRRYFGF